ncbi:hypothetical protein DVH24_010463 [Malus domestica]|uniref:Uncharacterized protein n=1 Tax=Malus domestica TaxID=3750 RepID=A0A498JQT6_MALDO|nr:hypothetical protein DVH24_010463 [Malus domestica]
MEPKDREIETSSIGGVEADKQRRIFGCRCNIGCSIGQIEALQNTKKERPRGYTITIRSNLEWRCRAEVHRKATQKRMRRKVAKGRCKAEEVHSGIEEKMIVRVYYGVKIEKDKGGGTSRFRGKTERKITQNLSCGIAYSTRFRRTKHGMERFVPLHYVSSHVPNGTTFHTFGMRCMIIF